MFWQVGEKIRQGKVHQFKRELPKRMWLVVQEARQKTYMMPDATVFAVSPHGLLATCSHCIQNRTKTIQLFNHQGQPYSATLLSNNKQLDIALLQLNNPTTKTIPYFKISEKLPAKGSESFCIGNPHPFDLETTKTNVKTHFLPYHVSRGSIVGVEGDGMRQVGELGPLMHDCWTYWGHSGSPIVNMQGVVVGMHNSWDDENGMRRGMSCVSLQQAMKRFKNKIKK